MDFLDGVHNVTSLASWLGITTAGMLICGVGFYIWRRTRSTHSLMFRLWQLFYGKKECEDASVRSFHAEQSALMQFRFTTGICARTLKHVHLLIGWSKKNEEDIGDIAACGEYFDIEKIELNKKALPLRWQNGFKAFLVLILLSVSLISAFCVSVDGAIIQIKASHKWLLLSTDLAKPIIGSGTGLTPEQCRNNPLSNTGFDTADATLICGFYQDKNLGEFLKKTVHSQRIIFLLLALSFAWYFKGLTIWLLQGVAARKMYQRLALRTRELSVLENPTSVT
jgi:hypothetical protein